MDSVILLLRRVLALRHRQLSEQRRVDSICAFSVHVINREMIDHARFETSQNRAEVGSSFICACVACGRYFFPEEVKKYDRGSALCPFCGCRSVLPDSCHLPMSPGFLRLVRDGLVN
jgi:hypothetical protein